MFSRALGREEPCEHTSLECAHSDSATLVCPGSWRVCFPRPHRSDSRLLCRELSEEGPGLHELPRSKPLRSRFSGTPPRRRRGWASVLRPSQARAAQVTRCLARVFTPGGGCSLPPPWFPPLGYLAFLGVPCVYLGSCSLPVTLPADVDRPEPQEVLVSREVCLQFGGCLSGADCPFLALAALPCLSQAGNGPGHVLGLGFLQGSWDSYPTVWVATQPSSLRSPSGYSGPDLTLSNAACSSLSLPRLQVGEASVWAAAVLGVAVRHLICGISLFIYLSFCLFCPLRFQGLPKTRQREFPGVWKILFFKTPFPGSISIPTSFVSFFIFYILSYLLSETMDLLHSV